MDRERLFQQLNLRYASKREMLSRIPLGTQPDQLWQDLLSRRHSRATILPIRNHLGMPYWYVTTNKMIAASERIVESLLENECDFDPYTDPPPVVTLEEVFYTSYVDGAHITIQEAMEFLQSDLPPRDIEEQMIFNNRLAGSYASGNLYRMIDVVFLQELAYILTDGMDGGGQNFRTEDWLDIPMLRREEYHLPSAISIPDRVDELLTFLEDRQAHPLIKAAVSQAWTMVVRPFSEGNERLGRILSNIVLLRAGYVFLADISVSALIARKSYGYYEAIANIMRDENEGDLTYFLEYYLEVISRAVDERRLRLEMKNAEILKAEAALAQTSLFAAEAVKAADDDRTEDENADEEGTSDAPDDPGESDTLEGGELDAISLARIRDELYKSVAKGDGKLSRCSRLLLKYLDQNKYTFTSADFEKDIPVTSTQAGNLVTLLKAKGLLAPTGKDGKYTVYTIQPAFPALTEEDYSADLLLQIRELAGSSSSPKDKRLGAILLGCLPKGLITVSDYKAGGQESRFSTDMPLAQRMGLIERVDVGVYRILRALKPGLPELRQSQKEAVTEIYGAFGLEAFSREMIIATLDYSGPHASATLHELMLLRIVECKREDVLLYQLLVNPIEHPECFVEAS